MRSPPAGLQGTSLWEILSNLVAIDTATGSSTLPAAELLARRLDRPGWTVRVEAPADGLGASVIAWAGPPEPGGLVLSGHLDVVPWAEQPGWTRQPLRLVQDGDRLYGRGVADMKGAVAQYVALAEEIDPETLSKPLVLVLTSDEEIGCLGAERLAPRLVEILAVPQPRWALIGEPTGGRVFRAHKGHVRLSLTAHGRGGHSSRPDQGVNAIAAMAAAANAIVAFADEVADRTTDEAARLFPDYPAVPFNLGMISGGTADNMIAERCTLTVGFRPGPGTTADSLLGELVPRAMSAADSAAPGVRLTVDETIVTPGMTSPARGPLPDALRELVGHRELGGAPFATDGGHLQGAGIASYIWGPGELEQAHQPNESVSVTTLIANHETLRALVGRMCA